MTSRRRASWSSHGTFADRMPRAYLDANVFISYLLRPKATTATVVIVGLAFRNAFTLLVSEPVLSELRTTVAAKPYLASRIAPADVDDLVALLMERGESVPTVSEPYPEIGPDRRDDYLFAHAIHGQADYLVSGDDHLLSVGQIDGVGIVSPSAFRDILEQAGAILG